MIDRDVLPWLQEGADLPDLLREALETATGDELPGRARLNRIEHKLDAAIARDREAQALAPSPRISGLRPAAPQRHIRFAAAKIGLAALVGMGAAWGAVEGLRVYQAAFARTISEKPPERRAIELGPSSVNPAMPPSSAETPERESSLASDPDLDLAAPRVVARPETSPRVSSRPSSVPRIELPAAPLIVATAPPAPLEEDLLERATQALRRNPTEALALADEHARGFASGRLAQEREVVAIQALSKLGRFDAARARAQRFLAQYRNSAYANDVLRLAKSAER